MNKALWVLFFVAAFFVLAGPVWSQEIETIAGGTCPITKAGKLAESQKEIARYRNCMIVYDPAQKEILYVGIYDSVWTLDEVIQLDITTAKQKSFWKRGKHEI